MANDLKIYTDGGSRGNPGPAASAFVAYENGTVVNTESRYLGVATNNQAEYNAVVLALTWLETNPQSSDTIHFFLDSELVVRQLTGVYKIKDEKLKALAIKIKAKIEKLKTADVNFNAIPREKNKLADRLVNDALDVEMT